MTSCPKFLSCLLVATAFAASCSEKAVPADGPARPEWQKENDPFTAAPEAAVLDMTARNRENEEDNATGRNLYSAQHIAGLAGVPFFTTADPEEAMEKGNVILFSSSVKASSFTDSEKDALLSWVRDGGVIVAPAFEASDDRLAELFGISAASYNKTRTSITWDDSKMDIRELEYVDEPEEKDISLSDGKKTGKTDSVKSWGYTVGTASVLAWFDTSEAAVTENRLGKGTVYSFGVLWRDMIQRPQLNKDFSAQRSYSNDFEPSADAFPLFFRSVYMKYSPVGVWKSTIPDGFRTVLIPTHDCDSRTAYDEMHYMSEYEKSIGVKGQYFLTAHYYRDAPYLSAFYDGASIAQSKALLADGHRVGSHSIGHFADFTNTGRFPITVVGRDEYRASFNTATQTTTGGSTWAEVALSKQIIEEDLGNKVHSFRSGHLAMNKNIPQVLEDAGYAFSSCYGAGDVLTCFPYFERTGCEWDGRQSSVLQMPLHFSDVFSDNPINGDNWHEKPELWMKIMKKLAGNYAPSILLIHPNRDWKMYAQKLLVESMDRNTVGLYNFEDFGDFWTGRSRLGFGFSYISEKRKVMIRVNRNDIENNPHITFMVECGYDNPVSEIVVVDENSFSIPLSVTKTSAGKYSARLSI